MAELLQDRSLEDNPLGFYWFDRGDGGQVYRTDVTPYGGPPYTAYEGVHVLETLFSSAGEALGSPVAEDPAYGAQYNLAGAAGRTVRIGGYVFWPGFYGDGKATIQVRHGAGAWVTIWETDVNSLPLQTWVTLPETEVVMTENTLDVAFGGHVPGYHVPLKSGWLWWDLLSVDLVEEGLDLSAKILAVRDAVADRLETIDGTGIYVTTTGEVVKGPKPFGDLSKYPTYMVQWGVYEAEPGEVMHGVTGTMRIPVLIVCEGPMREADDLAAQAKADMANALEEAYDSGSGTYYLGLGSWVGQVTVTDAVPVNLEANDDTTGKVAWVVTVTVVLKYIRGGA